MARNYVDGARRGDGDDWNTLKWLRSQANNSREHKSAEHFSLAVADKLTKELESRQFLNQRDRGLGIHFTAYEWTNNCWGPELFLISNLDGRFLRRGPTGRLPCHSRDLWNFEKYY